jgi:DnaJ like chaperone protein
MSWWGTVGGAILGGMVGGPVGAGIGAAAGSAVASWFGSATENPALPTERLLRMTAAVYASLAKVDKDLSEREKDRIEQFLQEDNASLSPSVDTETLRSIAEVELTGTNKQWGEAWSKFSNAAMERLLEGTTIKAKERVDIALATFPPTGDFASLLMRRCFRLAAADLVINDAEVQWLASFASRIGISEAEFGFLHRVYYRTNDGEEAAQEAYEVLGVPRNAPREQIDQAYRTLARSYHPDRHPHLEGDELKAMEKRFSAVHHAYEAILTPADQEWWSRSVETGMAFRVVEREIVQCVSCSRKVRLPPAEHHWSARCPECQILLVYNEQDATELCEICAANAAAEQAEASHASNTSDDRFGRCPHCGKGYVAAGSNLRSDIQCMACKKTFAMTTSNSWT